MTGVEYMTAVGAFLQGCEMNLADPAAVTAALSLSSVAVTLTATQVCISSNVTSFSATSTLTLILLI